MRQLCSFIMTVSTSFAAFAAVAWTRPSLSPKPGRRRRHPNQRRWAAPAEVMENGLSETCMAA